MLKELNIDLQPLQEKLKGSMNDIFRVIGEKFIGESSEKQLLLRWFEEKDIPIIESQDGTFVYEYCDNMCKWVDAKKTLKDLGCYGKLNYEKPGFRDQFIELSIQNDTMDDDLKDTLNKIHEYVSNSTRN